MKKIGNLLEVLAGVEKIPDEKVEEAIVYFDEAIDDLKEMRRLLAAGEHQEFVRRLVSSRHARRVNRV